MKKIWKKLLSGLFLSMGMLALSSTAASAEKTGLDMVELQRKYPNAAYWNHVVKQGHNYLTLYAEQDICNNPEGYTWKPCTKHFFIEFHPQKVGWYDCNRFGGSIQCRGFASKLAYDVYGENFHSWRYTPEETSDIKPGDIMFYDESPDHVSSYGHQAMVIDVNGTKLCLAECNALGECMISWGRWIRLEDAYMWKIFHAPYELPKAGVENLIQEKKGDVDQDGIRTLADARFALQSLLHMTNLSETQTWSADMDGDGTITLQDVQFILRTALNIEYIQDDAVEMENEQLKYNELKDAFDKEFFKTMSEEEQNTYLNEHYSEYFQLWMEYFEKNK